MSENNLTCKIIAPEENVFQGAAQMVVVPIYDGELGILPGHSGLIVSLSCGECRIVFKGTTTFYVEGGIVKVANGKGKTEVVLLVELASSIAKLKNEKHVLREEFERAQQLTVTDDESFERRQRAVKFASKKLELIEKLA